MMRRFAPNRRTRGFAVFWVIVTIPMIAMTIAALSRLLIFDAKRTQQIAAQAQLRQMLMAATVSVTASGQLKPDDKIALAPQSLLPPDIINQDGTLELKIETSDANRVRIRINATLGKYKANQTLIFQKRQDRFMLVETKLND